jgi:hypothetical protein
MLNNFVVVACFLPGQAKDLSALRRTMSIDCGDHLVLNVNIGSIACSQLLETWPGNFARKCIRGGM